MENINGCELSKCQYYKDGKCNDPIEYINEFSESVCGRRDDAISYCDHIEMLNDNPPMMSFDKPCEY